MIVLVHDLNSGWCCEIEIDSRPNIKDGIYLSDYDNLIIKYDGRFDTPQETLNKMTYLAKQEIEEATRFVVTDVVFGKLFEFEKMQWIIQGELHL